AAFKTFANKHPELYEYLVILLAARLRETDAAIAAGSFLPNKGRLACTLLELVGDFGHDLGGRIVIRQMITEQESPIGRDVTLAVMLVQQFEASTLETTVLAIRRG